MNSPFSLVNKTVFLTGAASGIGRAIAVECSKMGANLIITDRNQQLLQETFNLLDGKGHIMFIVDLTDYVQLSNMVIQLPKLDGVVSNAGIIKTVLIQQSDKKDVTDIFNVNTFAPIYLMQLLLQNKKINKNASIVITSSMAGVFNGAVGNGLYGASKAALNGFVKSIALEVAPRGIRVNTINPGITETNIYQNTSISHEQLEEEKKRYPLKRFGKPEEIAYAVIYLLSDSTQWMTGTSLLIDGGCSLQ